VDGIGHDSPDQDIFTFGYVEFRIRFVGRNEKRSSVAKGGVVGNVCPALPGVKWESLNVESRDPSRRKRKILVVFVKTV
jgi:hypothetical protein